MAPFRMHAFIGLTRTGCDSQRTRARPPRRTLPSPIVWACIYNPPPPSNPPPTQAPTYMEDCNGQLTSYPGAFQEVRVRQWTRLLLLLFGRGGGFRAYSKVQTQREQDPASLRWGGGWVGGADANGEWRRACRDSSAIRSVCFPPGSGALNIPSLAHHGNLIRMARKGTVLLYT